jgi:hypothetical protein
VIRWDLDVEERRARWDAHVARFGSGPAWEHVARFGTITPTTVSEFHPDPARRMVYYTGTGHPYHLGESPVPLFLSITSMIRYKKRGQNFPVRMGGSIWAGDSGAYAALMLSKNTDDHPWSMPADEYGSTWVRLIDDIGPPKFVAVQDWPCESSVLSATGMTVQEHQDLTLESYLYLSEQFPMVPWLAVLQGWHPEDYLRHFEAYKQAGVDLRHRPAGIGSVCRRGSQIGIARVLETLAPLEMEMHGFGVSINGLRLAGHLLSSSDSQAWSLTARKEGLRLAGCTHTTLDGTAATDCRNCFHYAVQYRERVMQALRDGAAERAVHGSQLTIDDLLAELEML